MAMIADAFTGKLTDVLKDLITEEVVVILGVKDDLQRLQEKLEMIKAVLSDAERLRIKEKTTNLWLSKLKDVMYDADDIIDLCRIKGRGLLQGEDGVGTLLRRLHYSLTSIPLRHHVGKEIQRLNQRLEEIYKDSVMFRLQRDSTSTSTSQGVAGTGVDRSTSPLPPSDFVDFVGGKTLELAGRLINSLVKTEDESLLVFAIVGLGGIGKTTLAQKIIDDQKVQSHFQKKCWVCVTKSYSKVELLKQMIRSMDGEYGQKNTTAELLPLLKSTLEGTRFLLVLDDVWTEDVWEHLLRDPLKQACKSSSRVLITTRDEDVAKRMGARDKIHRVEKLSAKDGWELICKSVFENEADEDIQSLREIGMQIVKKCDGLPLAIKAIAGVLKEKKRKMNEWVKVYESQAWSVGGELPEEVRGALYLSYEDLPSQLKQCFLLCSLFPEDYIFSRVALVRWWIAEGSISPQGGSLLEDIAEGCYNSLVSRNLLHSERRYGSRCTMHDLTRSLAVFLAGDENYLAYANESITTKFSKLRRLAIFNRESHVVVLDAIENARCLRTLIADNSGLIKGHDLLRFNHLRMLNLSRSMIESIPESIRNLHHLRYLDLDGTSVHELPESIGSLSNLQFLNLNRCKSLRTLPKAITQLCNLRYLGLRGTPVGFVPSGIGQLRNLNDLEGFVVGDDGDNHDVQPGCRLDELQSISNLIMLGICKLERVQTGGVQPLKDKCHLKVLELEWSKDADQSLISRVIEEICESLSPPPNLETLMIRFFIGNRFPTWISALHNLTQLRLHNCLSCRVLPPLGKLRQLKCLEIKNADSVVTVGHEFLGLDTMDSDKEASMTAFPKLEMLSMDSMPNWEEWTIDMKEIDGGRRTTLELLPRLRKLHLYGCPKLRALPDGLRHAASLKDCNLCGTLCLREIKNTPSLITLWLSDNLCLESISNLPARKILRIEYSSTMLKSVEKLSKLQKLWVGLEDDGTDELPDWLLRLLQEAETNKGCLQQLRLESFSESLRKRCSEGGQYWPLLAHIPHLTVTSLYSWRSLCDQ